MYIRVPIFSLLLALFLFFRYLRANMNVTMLLANFVFMGVTIYEAKGNIAIITITAGLIIAQSYIVFLKVKSDPRIIRFQAGYKPIETIWHYAGFAIALSIAYFITGLAK